MKILLLGFLLRLVPFIYVAVNNPEGILVFDSYGYLDIADNLMDHQVFSRASEGQILMPDISRTPTFPFLLVALKLFSDSTIWISFVLLLFGAFNVLLTFRLADHMTSNNRIAALSAILIAVDVPSIFFSSIIMSETIFTTLLLGIVYLMVKENSKMMRFLILGLLMAILILCRPIAIFLPLVFVGYFIYQKVSFKSIGLFLIGSYLLVGLWSIRNYQEFNTFRLSSVGSTNLYFHTSSAILIEAEGLTADEARNKLWTDLQAQGDWDDPKTEMEPMISYCNQKAWGYIKEHPVIFLKQYTIGVIYFFYKPIRSYIDTYLGISKSNFNPLARKNINENALAILKNETSVLTIVLMGFQLAMLVFMGIGVAWGILKPEWKPIMFFLIIVIGYFAVFSAFTEVDGRFRIPIIPFFALVSVYGWSKIFPKKFERQ